MTRDILIQRLPADIASADQIPADFVPEPLGTRADVVQALQRLFPELVLDASGFGSVGSGKQGLDVDIGPHDEVVYIALGLRGKGQIEERALMLVAAYGGRALDPTRPSGIWNAFEMASGASNTLAAPEGMVAPGHTSRMRLIAGCVLLLVCVGAGVFIFGTSPSAPLFEHGRQGMLSDRAAKRWLNDGLLIGMGLDELRATFGEGNVQDVGAAGVVALKFDSASFADIVCSMKNGKVEYAVLLDP